MIRFLTHNPSFLAVSALLAITFLATGCDRTGTLDAEGPTGEMTDSFVANKPDSVKQTSFTELSEEEQTAFFRRQRETHQAFRKAALTASDWQQADQRVRSLLAEPSPFPQYYREQLAAHWMLKRWLLEGTSSPSKQKAVGFYTELMLKNESPQGQTIAPALEQLKGEWSKERIAEAAAATARRTKEYMQGSTYQSALRQFDQQEDQLKTKASKQAFRASANSFQTSMTSAVSQLEALARSDQ